MAPIESGQPEGDGTRAIQLGALVSFFAPLAIFLVTLCPGLFWRDVPEFAMVPFLLDISHPPGSPTYALIGKLASLLPIGSVALKANLLSAVVGALASLLVYLACVEWIRLVSVKPRVAAWHAPLTASASAGAAILLSFATANWYWATVAEVYTTLIAATAGCLWLAARFLRSGAADRHPPAVWAYLLALVAGLSAGVHPNGILFLPAICLFVFAASFGRLRGPSFFLWPLFLALGLSVYLYLPVRSQTPLVYDYGNPETLRGLIDHVTARSYAERIYDYPWDRALSHWARVPWMIAGQLGFPAALAGVFGLGIAVVRRPLLAGLALAFAVANLWLVKDWTAAFGYLPVLLVWTMLAALGAVQLGAFVLNRFDESRTPLPARGLNLVLALLVLLTASAQLGRWWTEDDKHGHTLAERHGKAVLASLPTGAVLISSADHLSYVLSYLQNVERVRPDVAHIHQAYLPHAGALVDRWPELNWPPDVLDGDASAVSYLLEESPKRPLFVDRTWFRSPVIPAERLVPHGIVYRVTDEPTASIGEVDLSEHVRIWNRYFVPILSDPWFAPADWTGRQVYAAVQNGLAEFFYLRGLRASMLDALRRAREICPECPFAYHNQAQVDLADGEMEAARSILEAGLAACPDDPKLLADSGRWLSETGRGAEAIPFLERAVSFDPDLEEARATLAKELLRAGRPAEAVRHAEVLWRSATDPGRRVTAGLIVVAGRRDRGDVAGARAVAEELVRLSPNDPVVIETGRSLGIGVPRIDPE